MPYELGLTGYLKAPKFEFVSNAKPSLFAYPPPTKPPTREPVTKVTTAVLSTTAKAKARERTKEKERNEIKSSYVLTSLSYQLQRRVGRHHDMGRRLRVR